MDSNGHFVGHHCCRGKIFQLVLAWNQIRIAVLQAKTLPRCYSSKQKKCIIYLDPVTELFEQLRRKNCENFKIEIEPVG